MERFKHVLSPRRPDNEHEQEFQKGEIAGMEMIMAHPKLMVENQQAIVDDLESQLERNQENENGGKDTE